MIDNLQGQFVILTGAAAGLGYAIAQAYAREGLRLALMDVQAEKLQRVAAEAEQAGAECLPIVVDLSDAAATQDAMQQALDRFGTPRAVVHNAALLVERPMSAITFEQWRRETDIILQAAFILSKAVWSPMLEARSGSIVYLSSGSGIKGFVNEAAYCPAKHGQEGLMKVLSMEGAEYNIAVNTITPGAPMNTPMSASHYPPELRTRWIDPALLTPAFVWLAKIDASDSTGQRLDAWQLSESLRNAN